MAVSFRSIKLWVQNLINLVMWKVLCSSTQFLKVRLWAPSIAGVLGAVAAVAGHGHLEVRNTGGHQNSPTFSSASKALCASKPFSSSLEACGQKDDDATATCLPPYRWKTGVVHPWGYIQSEISENRSFLALLWKMGILTFYLENYIHLFSTSSN